MINSLYDIWKFVKDKYFLAINLIYDEKIGIRNFTKEEIKSLSVRKFVNKLGRGIVALE